MARPERLELPTPRSVVWCSIQLSYGRSQARGCSGRPPKRQEAPNPPGEPKEGQGRCPWTPPEGAALWTPAKGGALGTLHLIGARQGGQGRPGLPPSHRAAAQADPVPPVPCPIKSDGVQKLCLWRGRRGGAPSRVSGRRPDLPSAHRRAWDASARLLPPWGAGVSGRPLVRWGFG